MEKIFENEEMIILSEHTLDDMLNEIVSYTCEKFDLYRNLFKVDILDKITIKIFDNLEKYREDYYKTRGKEAPSYSRGWFNSRLAESILCIEPIEIKNKNINPYRYHKKISSPSHEAFHYYYGKYYYGNDRITWFDEGMAQYISEQFDILSQEEMENKFKDFIDSYIPVTNLNDRINGNSDIPDNLIFNREGIIQGYSLSFFCIKYIVDVKGEEYLYKLMFNNEKIREIGNYIINEMIEYYTNKYNMNFSNNKKII